LELVIVGSKPSDARCQTSRGITVRELQRKRTKKKRATAGCRMTSLFECLWKSVLVSWSFLARITQKCPHRFTRFLHGAKWHENFHEAAIRRVPNFVENGRLPGDATRENPAMQIMVSPRQKHRPRPLYHRP
jgi:hypothetical protein